MQNSLSLTLTCSEDSKPMILEPSCLLVFIDETGDEGFSDARHPVFGLGGCALPVADYTRFVRPRWLEMKQQHFGGRDARLHANELSSPTSEQMAALCAFFSTDRFTRVVSVASSKTAFPDGCPTFQLIALSLIKRIEHAASRFLFSRIALIIESSSRANSLANQYLGPFDTARMEGPQGPVEAPIDHYFLPKKLNEPGNEIADFIMHAVGCQVRSQLREPSSVRRKDFSAVFDRVPKHAVEYFSIDNACVNVV